MTNRLVSIVICTFRRPDLVADALQSLRAVAMPAGVRFEALLVDNDPQASARSLVSRLAADWPSHADLRYVHEPRTGLSHARNRGLDEAHGDIVAFLDDDVLIDSRWLTGLVECFDRTGADCVGGRAPALWEGAPEPAVQACDRELVSFDLGDSDLPLVGGTTPFGANLAFRRAALPSALRFADDLGRVGCVLLSGEDEEFVLRLRRHGGRIWYSARSIVLHRTGGDRLTAAYYLRRHYWFGVSRAVIDGRLSGRGRQLTRALARGAALILVELPRWMASVALRDSRRRLLSGCALRKHFGYIRMALVPRSAVRRDALTAPLATMAITPNPARPAEVCG